MDLLEEHKADELVISSDYIAYPIELFTTGDIADRVRLFDKAWDNIRIKYEFERIKISVEEDNLIFYIIDE